ncbi:hypothetical protein JCM5350_007931 [Sporobolomyces pararoseus]
MSYLDRYQGQDSFCNLKGEHYEQIQPSTEALPSDQVVRPRRLATDFERLAPTTLGPNGDQVYSVPPASYTQLVPRGSSAAAPKFSSDLANLRWSGETRARKSDQEFKDRLNRLERETRDIYDRFEPHHVEAFARRALDKVPGFEAHVFHLETVTQEEIDNYYSNLESSSSHPLLHLVVPYSFEDLDTPEFRKKQIDKISHHLYFRGDLKVYTRDYELLLVHFQDPLSFAFGPEVAQKFKSDTDTLIRDVVEEHGVSKPKPSDIRHRGSNHDAKDCGVDHFYWWFPTGFPYAEAHLPSKDTFSSGKGSLRGAAWGDALSPILEMVYFLTFAYSPARFREQEEAFFTKIFTSTFDSIMGSPSHLRSQGLVVVHNLAVEVHTDIQDSSRILTSMTPTGRFTGGELRLPQFGILVEYKSYDVCFINSPTVSHQVLGGQDHCIGLGYCEGGAGGLQFSKPRSEVEWELFESLVLRAIDERGEEEIKMVSDTAALVARLGKLIDQIEQSLAIVFPTDSTCPLSVSPVPRMWQGFSPSTSSSRLRDSPSTGFSKLPIELLDIIADELIESNIVRRDVSDPQLAIKVASTHRSLFPIASRIMEDRPLRCTFDSHGHLELLEQLRLSRPWKLKTLIRLRPFPSIRDLSLFVEVGVPPPPTLSSTILHFFHSLNHDIDTVRVNFRFGPEGLGAEEDQADRLEFSCRVLICTWGMNLDECDDSWSDVSWSHAPGLRFVTLNFRPVEYWIKDWFEGGGGRISLDFEEFEITSTSLDDYQMVGRGEHDFGMAPSIPAAEWTRTLKTLQFPPSLKSLDTLFTNIYWGQEDFDTFLEQVGKRRIELELEGFSRERLETNSRGDFVPLHESRHCGRFPHWLEWFHDGVIAQCGRFKYCRNSQGASRFTSYWLGGPERDSRELPTWDQVAGSNGLRVNMM